MKRVLVLGCPGSGKSTFSRKLSAKTKLPICYLDQLLWNADKTTVKPQVFNERLNNELSKEKWIMDGNYRMSLAQRLQACDTVFLLDYPVELCLKSVEERVGKKREDLPWVEEKIDPRFMTYIRNFSSTELPKTMQLVAQYPDKKLITFKNRQEADKYLKQL